MSTISHISASGHPQNRHSPSHAAPKSAASQLEPRQPPAVLPAPLAAGVAASSGLHGPPANQLDEARAPFSPFFTLVSDPAASSSSSSSAAAAAASYVHPSRVHYLFSDDSDAQTDLLTAACLRALEASASSSTASLASSAPPASSSAPSASPPPPPPPPARPERVLIVDVSAAGDAVVRARSLAADWQVLRAEIATAPTWDGGGAGDGAGEGAGEGGTRGLMLRIEGTGQPRTEPELLLGRRSGDADEDVEEGGVGADFEALMEALDRNMTVLRRVVEAGAVEDEEVGEGDELAAGVGEGEVA